jgi:hypothetical protein
MRLIATEAAGVALRCAPALAIGALYADGIAPALGAAPTVQDLLGVNDRVLDEAQLQLAQKKR